MDKNEIMVSVAAILTTLLEMDGHWSPRTPVYMALGWDMGRFIKIEGLMVASGMVKATTTTITLTQKGIDLASEIEAVLTKKKAGKS